LYYCIFATLIALLVVFYIAYIIYASIVARRKKKKEKVGIEVNSTNYDPSDVLFQDNQFFRDPSSISSINYESRSNFREGTIQSYMSQNLLLPPPPRVHLNDETSYIYLQNNYRPQPYYPTPYFCISKDNLHFTYSSPHNQQHRHSHYSCHFFTPNRRANSQSIILSPNNNSLNVNTNPNRINSC